ncbi:MAG: right-handed parallel beta-helix repeat-containing protein [Thiobacillus sp.]|nr:right-handed parallel beta-helix repeat-containing protein [Thiobacillus sp.]
MASATDYRAGPGDYREQLRRLQPGDRLLLKSGDYRQGLPLHELSGRSGQPIIIEALDPSAPLPRFIARPGANTVSLINVRYLVLRYLELDGRNVPVDAIKAEGQSRFADFITLERIFIHDHAASQQNVGISTKCPALGWMVRNNRIQRVGTGMYFGDADGTDPFVAGVIEGNQVSDTLGYNLQIKHQKARPADMPESGIRHDTLIRHNFFSKENALPGPDSRPNVLVGHFPLTEGGSRDRYLIYANLFWQNPSEALFQGEGNIALYNNVLINPRGSAVRVQPHNDVLRHVDIFHNTVVARDEGIVLRNPEAGHAYPQGVTANVIFAARPLSSPGWVGNLTGPYDSAARDLRKPFASLEELDLAPHPFLSATSSIPAGYPDADLDYTYQTRVTGEIGACESGRPIRDCGMGFLQRLFAP